MIGYEIAVSTVAIMISIGGIVLGIGYGIDDRRLKSFGKDELLQSFINAIIIGALFTFFSPNGLGISLVNSVVQSSNIEASCSGFMSDNYAICFADNYLVGVQPVGIGGARYPSLLDASFTLLAPLTGSYLLLGVISATELNLGFASFSFSSILSPVMSEESFIIKLITFGIIDLYTQSALLSVVSLVAIPLLLPVGIVLRTFYLTRKIGGTIIAIAIGLFAVYPLTYLLDAQITANYSTSLGANAFTAFNLNSQSIQEQILSAGSSSISTNSITNFGSGLLSSLTNVASSFTDVLRQVMAAISVLIIEVFFFPLFSLIITIVSIRELATALGSEVSFGKFDIF